MNRADLYRLLQPGSLEASARAWRGVHHAMAAAGIGVMLALTVPELRGDYSQLLSGAFYAIAVFFVGEYALRLYVAPEAPGGDHRGVLGSRLAWVLSLAGAVDLLGVMPAAIALFDHRDASLFGFVWVFKFVRYSPGLTILRRVITHARHALLSVLLGVVIVLLTAGSLAYLLERNAQPEAFGSIPSALWWAIVTLTTTGYGDAVPHTVAGRMLAGVVMVSGILVFALWAGILATGYADEMRRREFLRTWDLVARVPFFHDLGATLIAEVARLLRVRDYPAGAVIMRRGEPGDCMYFVAEGEVEVLLEPQSLRFGADYFFGELALLTGAPRNATVVTSRPCVLLVLDIVDFFELLGRQPELARVIHDEAGRRLAPGTPVHAALRAMIVRDTEPAE
jgi:voltage-gated potassium channel